MKHTEEQVQGFLDTHYNHSAREGAALAEGGWAQAYTFTRDGRDYVIRFGMHVNDFLKDQIASSFNTENLPVPKVDEVGRAFDGFFAVADRAYGEMLDELDQAKMRRVLPEVFNTLDAIRRIDVSNTEGFGGWDGKGRAPFKTWKEYLLSVADDPVTRRTHGWRKSLISSPIGDSVFNEAYERLTQLVDNCPNDKYMIHTDLLNKNVLVQDDSISAVIDWGNAMYGDFLHDIAAFSFWSSWFPSMKGIDWEEEARKHFEKIGLEVPDMEERLLCYKLHIGLDAQAYNAYMHRWDELEINSNKTSELAKVL